tara:strand:- start:4279 stop:4620 length:342 start_codon:yes stop_codon:yes gene_type:complete
MLEFYERQRDKHYAAYLAAVEMEDEEIAAKHFKEYENNLEQVDAFMENKIKQLESELINLQLIVTEIQESLGDVSCFVENLDHDIKGRHETFNTVLEIGNKIRDLDLPEFTLS